MPILIKVAQTQAWNKRGITTQTSVRPRQTKLRRTEATAARTHWLGGCSGPDRLDQLIVRMPVKLAFLVESLLSTSSQVTVVPGGEAMAADVTV